MAGSLITNVREIFPSIYIAPIIDNTEYFEVRDRGNALTAGYWGFGNPYRPIKVNKSYTVEKSTKPLQGGNVKNEIVYHINDFISISGGSVFLARVLGSASTLTVLKVDDGDTLTKGNEVNIFGADSILEWDEVTATSPLELLLAMCPQETVTVDVDFSYEDMMLEVKVYDELGSLLYSVAGNIDPLSKDDYDKSDFIGNMTNEDYLILKVDKDDAMYGADFSATYTYVNGVVTDAGDVNHTQVEKVMMSARSQVDYFFSAGSFDEEIVNALIKTAKKESISGVVDLFSTTVEGAIQERVEYDDVADSNIQFIWGNAKFKYDAGVQRVGTSGWMAGQKVKLNLSNIKGDAENRMDGVAGVRFPIGRTLSGAIEFLTDDEKTALTRARVNYLEDRYGDVVVSDILSSSKKDTYLKSFPVADTVRFIDRTIARYIEKEMFKNIQAGKDNLDARVSRFLNTDCVANQFFDNDVPLQERIKYQITDEDGDTIVVAWQGYIEGVIRRGIVRPQIERIKG